VEVVGQQEYKCEEYKEYHTYPEEVHYGVFSFFMESEQHKYYQKEGNKDDSVVILLEEQ